MKFCQISKSPDDIPRTLVDKSGIHCWLHKCYIYVIQWFADLPNSESWSRILHIICCCLFKTTLKLRKKIFLLAINFFVWPIRRFLSQLKENKYYIIFVLQNSKFSKSLNDIHTYNMRLICWLPKIYDAVVKQ